MLKSNLLGYLTMEIIIEIAYYNFIDLDDDEKQLAQPESRAADV